jgi:membrane-associated phospholipid phosphatase
VVLLRWERKAAWRIAPMVAGLVLATVYCRFHYVLDAVAGAALALFTASVILGRSDLLTRGRAASYKGFAGSGLHP